MQVLPMKLIKKCCGLLIESDAVWYRLEKAEENFIEEEQWKS
jgi:hypothetical protein